MATKVVLNSDNLKQSIKSKALKIGFDACGISQIKPLNKEGDKLQEYIKKGHHAGMHYLEKNLDKRINPELLLDNARSIISVLLNYKPVGSYSDARIKIAKYAWGQDYHVVAKDMMNQLVSYIKHELFNDFKARVFIDSAPVFEKALAVRAGLGWIGKNSLLITKEHGSFNFIGEVISNLDLEADEPFDRNYCGSCQACVNACPTGAITINQPFDARKCIAYYTIEHKGSIPREIQDKMDGWVYGCDICQDACPWNKKTKGTKIERFDALKVIHDNAKLMASIKSKESFIKEFTQSAVVRIGFENMKRNLNTHLLLNE